MNSDEITDNETNEDIEELDIVETEEINADEEEENTEEAESREGRPVLSVVATPIGNLEDITLRAIRILKQATYIYAEDTRHAKRLLSHHDIHTPMRSYHAHTSDHGLQTIIEELKDGAHIALITDAGTPAISDPGSELVRVARKEVPDIVIEAIPGASALTAALSVSGLISKEFTFLGFLPHKKGRQTAMEFICDAEYATVFYESTHRILKAMTELSVMCEQKKVTKHVIIVREITKMFEEVIEGTAEKVRTVLSNHPQKQRGEFVVIVE